jgi:predicted unusual protein kinase regulating ubiquinone biosynthesis (AarF/ABC1/UbiB family)
MSTHIGTKPEDLFETINAFDKPVAAASLGQVYKARLKSTGNISPCEYTVHTYVTVLIIF